MNNAQFTDSNYPNCINFKELDLTSGCNAGCLYCSLAKHKTNAKPLNIQNLFENNYLPNGIYLSPNSDPFDPVAADLSFEIASYFLPKGVPILINTKNSIPDKTIFLLAKYRNLVIPQISIARSDQKLTDYLEPNTSTIEERFETVRRLSLEGLPVRVLMIPLFPGVDDKKDLLEEQVKKAKEAGAKGIKASYVVLRDSGSEKDNLILNKIQAHPALEESFKQMKEESLIHIGNGKIYPIEKRIETYSYIDKLCEKVGIRFLSCTILDPSMKKVKGSSFTTCNNVWKYQNEFLKSEPCTIQY